MPKQNLIVDKSFSFALKVVQLYKHLTKDACEYVLSKQLLRSGTSIGANVNEAIDAQSKADFIHKMSIALKEARETNYWLKLLLESGYTVKTDSLLEDSTELIRIITAIVKSSKETNH
ncbi:MAG: four helix bundle protein [Candidatus Cloacimonetes bacterium]|nr:four helix bundle protein [Candidatus Cloacimonadota bacterium]